MSVPFVVPVISTRPAAWVVPSMVAGAVKAGSAGVVMVGMPAPGIAKEMTSAAEARVRFLDGGTERTVAVDVLADAVAGSRVGEIGRHVDDERGRHGRRGDRDRAVRREHDLAEGEFAPTRIESVAAASAGTASARPRRERFRGAVELFPRLGVSALPGAPALLLEKVHAAVLAQERDPPPRRIRESPDGDRGRRRGQSDRRQRAGERSRHALEDHRAAAGGAGHRRDEIRKTVAGADVAGRERRQSARKTDRARLAEKAGTVSRQELELGASRRPSRQVRVPVCVEVAGLKEVRRRGQREHALGRQERLADEPSLGPPLPRFRTVGVEGIDVAAVEDDDAAPVGGSEAGGEICDAVAVKVGRGQRDWPKLLFCKVLRQRRSGDRQSGQAGFPGRGGRRRQGEGRRERHRDTDLGFMGRSSGTVTGGSGKSPREGPRGG